jgi:hypothetical protein
LNLPGVAYRFLPTGCFSSEAHIKDVGVSQINPRDRNGLQTSPNLRRKPKNQETWSQRIRNEDVAISSFWEVATVRAQHAWHQLVPHSRIWLGWRVAGLPR